MVGIMAGRLFTIEQIELIRRLRNSGITKEQVIEAFEQLDRLDNELGKKTLESASRNRGNSLYNGTGTTSCSYDGEPASVTLVRLDSVPQSASQDTILYPNHRSETSMQLCTRDSYGLQSNPPCGSSVASNESLLDGQTCNGEVSSPSASSISSPTSRLPSELTIIPISSSSTHSGGDNLQMCPVKPESSLMVPLQCLVNPLDLLQEDDCAELDELKKKGEDMILSEIRNFVMRYNIKQTMIAEMTKMSQAYVSRFFRGDISDMSDRTKNTFYMWYLTCKHNPWKLAQMCPNSGVKRMVSDTGDLIPLKRERFTFKAAHLSVLERYYEKDPYPDGHTREQIVDECNRAVERSGQERLLSERERVTLPVVNNWFNNRRKEAKKQMRQQHAAAMAIASGRSLSSQPASQSSLQSTTGWNSNVSYGINSMSASSHLDLTCEVDSDNSVDSQYMNDDDIIAIDMGVEDRGNVQIKSET